MGQSSWIRILANNQLPSLRFSAAGGIRRFHIPRSTDLRHREPGYQNPSDSCGLRNCIFPIQNRERYVPRSGEVDCRTLPPKSIDSLRVRSLRSIRWNLQFVSSARALLHGRSTQHQEGRRPFGSQLVDSSRWIRRNIPAVPWVAKAQELEGILATWWNFSEYSGPRNIANCLRI